MAAAPDAPAAAGAGFELHVAGTGLRGSGYPNATGTLELLRERLGWTIHDRCRWLPEGTTLWRALGGGGVRPLFFLARLMLSSLAQAAALVLRGATRRGWSYAPYPAVFLLWWLSWVPRALRPRVVADAYVSLWDAAFRDRAVAARGGAASALARRFEARALRAAALVLVDTVANKGWFVEEFRIPASRVRAVPLALGLPEAVAGRARPADGGASGGAAEGPLKVGFVGTLVPLHGIAVVADAVRRLHQDAVPVVFEIVGDGEDRAALVELAGQVPAETLRWVRDWRSMDQVCAHLRGADVCLGVFGGAGKAARVLPFKVYLALALGRPVLTQAPYSLPEGVPPLPAVTVAADGGELAAALSELGRDRARLHALGSASRAYYDRWLGPEALAREWQALSLQSTSPRRSASIAAARK